MLKQYILTAEISLGQLVPEKDFKLKQPAAFFAMIFNHKLISRTANKDS